MIKKYRNADTGVLFTLPEIRKEYEDFRSESQYMSSFETFSDYIDAEVPEEILEDIDWEMMEVGDFIHDDSGDPIAKVVEITENAVTIKPIEE